MSISPSSPLENKGDKSRGPGKSPVAKMIDEEVHSVYITVPLPNEIQQRIVDLSGENIFLWAFISQNDLWDEALEFLMSEGSSNLHLPFFEEPLLRCHIADCNIL